jgi:hypothetical protein
VTTHLGSTVLGEHWLAAEWPAPTAIRAGMTLRSAGSFGRHADAAQPQQLRTQLATELGLPSMSWLQQVHGSSVLELPSAAPMAPADAVFSRASQQACVVLSADCLPVLFCALDGSVIGAAHAGWRGLLAGVLEQTVAAMCARARAPLMAWLAPAIGPAAFQVGPEVRAAFLDRDPEAAAGFVVDVGDRWRADLYQLARHRLLKAGLHAEQIYGGNWCTFSDASRFFSYRREAGNSGRHATLIVRHPP